MVSVLTVCHVQYCLSCRLDTVEQQQQKIYFDFYSFMYFIFKNYNIKWVKQLATFLLPIDISIPGIWYYNIF